MSTNQHTPGPWKVDRTGVYIVDRDGRTVAKTTGNILSYRTGELTDGTDPEERANARLIAAAPDLLAALEDALSGWRYIRNTHGDLYGVGWDRVEEAASSAIAKARGNAQVTA